MFTSNPFAILAVFLSPLVGQAYIVLTIFAVVVGTLFDVLHKSSAKFRDTIFKPLENYKVGRNEIVAGSVAPSYPSPLHEDHE